MTDPRTIAPVARLRHASATRALRLAARWALAASSALALAVAAGCGEDAGSGQKGGAPVAPGANAEAATEKASDQPSTGSLELHDPGTWNWPYRDGYPRCPGAFDPVVSGGSEEGELPEAGNELFVNATCRQLKSHGILVRATVVNVEPHFVPCSADGSLHDYTVATFAIHHVYASHPETALAGAEVTVFGRGAMLLDEPWPSDKPKAGPEPRVELRPGDVVITALSPSSFPIQDLADAAGPGFETDVLRPVGDDWVWGLPQKRYGSAVFEGGLEAVEALAEDFEAGLWCPLTPPPAWPPAGSPDTVSAPEADAAP